MSGARKPTKRTRKSPQELLDAVQQRLDATPERLARAKDAGETPIGLSSPRPSSIGRVRRIASSSGLAQKHQEFQGMSRAAWPMRG